MWLMFGIETRRRLLGVIMLEDSSFKFNLHNEFNSNVIPAIAAAGAQSFDPRIVN